jgi:hypothetical protein
MADGGLRIDSVVAMPVISGLTFTMKLRWDKASSGRAAF